MHSMFHSLISPVHKLCLCHFSAIEKIISELSGALVEAGKSALDAQKNAIKAITRHNQQLKKAMDDADVRDFI